MDQDNQKNVILAFVLSMLVMVGWYYFYAGPQIEQERLRQQLAAEAAKAGKTADGQPATPPAGTATVPGAATTPPATTTAAPTREIALTLSPRVTIDTPALAGSISLKGGRIDDLVLKRYRETVEKTSANVVLLSPAEGPGAYYAEQGLLRPDAAALAGADTLWRQEGTGKLTPATPVVLLAEDGKGLKVRRTIAVDNDYMFTITDAVENGTAAPVVLSAYGLVMRAGHPHDSMATWILHEGLVGWLEGKLKELTYASAPEEPPQSFKQVGGWLGITDKYWAAVLIPDQAASFEGRMFGLKRPDNPYFQADYRREPVTVAAGGQATFASRMFAGAKVNSLIERYRDDGQIVKFGYLIDWGWFWFIAQPLLHLLEWLNGLLGNFGLAILAVTVLVKAVFYPLANRSYVSMSKIKKLQPEMQKIQERFKDDRTRQQQAIMELYKKEKVNPMSGCLPIFVQIPVFFALYKVLFVTIEMRHAPFFGWIRDLSAPDPTTVFNLFGLIPWTPPHLLMIGIWPLIMGVTMWLQMKLNPAPADPVQAKMFAWMPLVFTFMLAPFAAGLVIYWAWNNTLSVIQQSIIMSRQGVKVELLDNLKQDLGWLFGLFGRGKAKT